MSYFWKYSWLLVQLCIGYTTGSWPSTSLSNVNILGLFPDSPNASNSETTTLSVHSRAMFQAAIILSQRLNFTVENQLIGWKSIQTSANMIDALSITCQTVTDLKIVGIIGPGFSREVSGIASLSERIGIPTISYAATNPDLSDKNIYPSFYRTVPSDKAAANAVAQLFLRYNWTSAIIIYQNDAYGSGGADAITRTFVENKLSISDTLIFDIVTLSFYNDLKTILTNSVSRIVILWTSEANTIRIVQNALDNNLLGPQFLWISASTISLDLFNQSSYSKLVGMMTIIPAVGNTNDATSNTTLLNVAYEIWQQYEPETFPGSTEVDYYALCAFDATWSLIQALSKLCSSTTKLTSSCLSTINTSFCFDYRFLNAKSLLNIIDTIEFLGVSGPIKFSNITTDRIIGNYYVLKNIQSSSNQINYASILKYSDSIGWGSITATSVIIWPGNSLIPFTGIAGLSGVTLRIGVINAAPFTMVTNIIDQSGNNITKITGYAPDLIDALQSRLGFISEIIVVPSSYTYNQAVQGVANDMYDILVADVNILADRREIVDFSNAIFDNTIRIITREATTVNTLDFFSYLSPFSGHLWIVLLCTLLYSSVLIFLLERRENEALREKSIISAMAMSIWFVFGTLVGYGIDFHVETAAGRLLCMGLYMLSIILVATYTANLASVLTLSKTKNIISGIDDIKNGIIPFGRVGVLVGSSLESYYLREISSGSRNYYPLFSVDEIYLSLLNNTIDASIMDAGNLEYAVNVIYCNLTLVGAAFAPSSYGIAMPKGWSYGQALDIAVLSIRESGELDTLKRKWWSQRVCDSSLDSDSDPSDSIALISTAGLFLTFLAISILALMLFVWLKRRIIINYLKSLISRNKSLPEKVNGYEENPSNFNNKDKPISHTVDLPDHRVVASWF